MTTEAPLGEVAQLGSEKIALAQRVITLRGKSGFLDSTFLLYLLQDEGMQDQLKSRATGTTVLGIKQSELRKISVTVPPIKLQKDVASVLSALDARIALLRETNTILEAIAQTLFKSWFVDFDPVRAKREGREPEGVDADIAALFPDSFEESELGLVPKGWRVLTLPEVTIFREGPGILAKDFKEHGVPLIRLAGLKNGVSLLDGCNFLDPVKVEKKWPQFRLLKGDILLSSSASLGRVAEVDDEAVGTIPYTGIIGFRPIEGKTHQRYIHHYLSSAYFQDQVVMMGAGSVLNHFGPTHLKNMLMLVPPLGTQKVFSDFVDPINRAQYSQLKQAQTLSTLRDTLLPRLISGQLRLPDAESLVEEATA